MKKPFEPNLRTPRHEQCREENNKSMGHLRRQQMAEEFRDANKPDIEWQSEQIAKSYGIYLEFNRAKTGSEKDWMYMIRISNPGGGPITSQQWQAYDNLSEKYTVDPNGSPSIRLTTRQNIQYHWVKKDAVNDIVKTLAEKGMLSINGCGDNTRNVMGCPLGHHSGIFDANKWAHKIGEYFQLPLEPFIQIFSIDPKYLRTPEESFQYGPNLLNRKFKIAFSGIHRDPKTGTFAAENCTEILTNDVGVAPILEEGVVKKFQVYIGGGQGERNGKPSMAALAQPLAIVTEEQLLPVLDAVVQIHQEWGDRQNRFWARIKYVVKKMGIDWYRDQVSQRLGFPLQKPDLDYDFGSRDLHFGWYKQADHDLWSYGAFIENGRVTDDSPNGKIKTMIRELMNKYPTELMITPNQDIIFTNIPEESKADFESDLASFGYGTRNGKPYSALRTLSGACVGRDTCRLTYTDSEKFEPFLIDELEKLGWGDMTESIGITGCERQCFRPATKTIGLVGSGLNRYQFKLFGDEEARSQGLPLISSDGNEMHLRSVPRDKVPIVINVLFKLFKDQANDGENMGPFLRRLGANEIIKHLKENDATAELMTKPFNTDCVID